MRDLRQADVHNTLLATMSAGDFGLLAPGLERIAVKWGDCLSASGETIANVYFPEEGLGSITIEASPHRVEVGVVGREGMVGLPVLLGGESCATNAFVQMPGTFLRISAADFRNAVGSSPTMMALFLLYVQAYIIQVSCTAMANAGFTVEQRLARWLLMSHDRADGDELALTHDFLALMLGVRRPGVTVATHVLEGERMIRANRGRITVLDRDKLRAFAKGSYGQPEAEYDRLIGSWPRGAADGARRPLAASSDHAETA